MADPEPTHAVRRLVDTICQSENAEQVEIATETLTGIVRGMNRGDIAYAEQQLSDVIFYENPIYRQQAASKALTAIRNLQSY